MKIGRNESAFLATALRKLADLIENSDQEEIERIFDRWIDAATKDRTNDTLQSKSKRLPAGKKDWLRIADRLRGLETRDEGQQFLENLSPTRADLERLARTMNLPVSKQDNLQRLKDKIVEFGIGSRLSSQAIRGD